MGITVSFNYCSLCAICFLGSSCGFVFSFESFPSLQLLSLRATMTLGCSLGLWSFVIVLLHYVQHASSLNTVESSEEVVSSDFCWQGNFTFGACCTPEGTGNIDCWDDFYTYDTCCASSSGEISATKKPVRPSKSPVYPFPHHGTVDEKLQVVNRWLSTFVAADPEYQQLCLDIMLGKEQISQFGQDLFVFEKLFLPWAVEGKKGFYVDSGANHWIFYSNSFFFDKCLGWDGLCVEPMPHLIPDLQKKRGCSLFFGCISDAERTVVFEDHFILGKVLNETEAAEKGGRDVNCKPLRSLLRDVAHRDPALGVDFWSLDIEGHEPFVVSSLIQQFVPIGSVLLETAINKTIRNEVDGSFARIGLSPESELKIDTLYINEAWRRRRGFSE
eukprot:GDKH01006943.1.p1 GENE.GDKH01006943.1~~GDKH01006943.1.p1  ORF type:complete len:387 (+),score=16.05 GDKH01006943.1:1-1161(+)